MAIFAPFLRVLWECAGDMGLDAAGLFREAGIDPQLRLDPTARVNARQLDRLVHDAAEKSHDETFVFQLAEHLHPSYLGVMGYAWLTSATLRKGLERLCRYQAILADEEFIQVENHDSEFHVLLDRDSATHADSPLREAMRFANLVRLCRMDSGDGFKPSRILFKHPEPARPAAYYQYFRCDLVFDSGSSRLVMDSATADQPLPGFNAEMESILEQQIIEYMARLDKQDVVGRTKHAIIKLLPSGKATIDDTAGELHTSVRTLRRKLRERAVSFKELLAETRRELGERYIQDSSLSLTEVAFLLGFSDSSSFSRAYKNWTGLTPSKFRSSQHTQDGS